MKKERFPIWETVELKINSLCNQDCFFCPQYNNRNRIRKDQNRVFNSNQGSGNSSGFEYV